MCKFIQPAFIRRNTPELRNKLEELGYKQVENGVDEWHIPMSKLPYLETGYDGRVGNYFVGENGYWHTCAIDAQYRSVIGNIHDTPELLK